MRFRGRRTPNVEKLLRQGKLEQLEEAAGFRDRLVDRNGEVLDRGGPIRVAAIRALAEHEPPEGADPPQLLALFAERLRDDSPEVARAAATALGQAGSPHAAWALVDLMAERGPQLDERTRETVLDAARACRCAGISARWSNRVARTRNGAVASTDRDDLVALLDADAEAEPRQRVFEALAAEIVQPDAQGDTPRVAETILSWCLPAQIDGLVNMIERHDVTEASIRLAGQSGDQALVDPLTRLLEHPRAEVRSQAALALGALCDTATVLPLMGATSDPDVRVRKSAVSALEELGSAGVTAAVAAMAHSASQVAEPGAPSMTGSRTWRRTLERLTERSGLAARARRRLAEPGEHDPQAGMVEARSQYESLLGKRDDPPEDG